MGALQQNFLKKYYLKSKTKYYGPLKKPRIPLLF